MSMLEHLAEKKNFTETEMAIADYLLQHRDEMSSITITQVTQETFSSNASVIRTCKKLGLNSFRELRLRIIQESERHRNESKLINMDFPFRENDSIDDITGSISDLMTETIAVMKELPLSAELKKAAQLVQNAAQVYYNAEGDTLLTVKAFVNRLIKLNIHAIYADENKELDARIQHMQLGDVFLCVSYSGKSTLGKEKLLQLKRRRVKTILITAAKDINGYDLIISFPDREHYYDQKIATFYSQTAISYLLNCIFAIIYRYDENKLQSKNKIL